MANKLLLIKDVQDLGRSGDIVNVKPGYARNYLLPSGSAVIADRSALRLQTRLKIEREAKAALDKKEAEKMASIVNGMTLAAIVKVDHAGHMYGSVTAQDVVDLLSETAKIIIEKRALSLKHAIKQTGSHTIDIKFDEGVTASIVLNVVSDQEPVVVEAETETPAES